MDPSFFAFRHMNSDGLPMGEDLSKQQQSKGREPRYREIDKARALSAADYAMFARDRIWSILTELGYHRDTSVKITVNCDGEQHIEADHPDHERIEAVLSASHALRDMLLGGRRAAELERIDQSAAQLYKSVLAVDAWAMERAERWMPQIIEETRQLLYVSHYQQGFVRATFVDRDGRVVLV